MNDELFGLLGIDPKGAKEKAFTRGLLSTIFNAAALSGPQARPISGAQALGQLGLGAMEAYEGSFDKTLQEAIRGLQVKDLLQKRQQQEKLQQAVAGSMVEQPVKGLGIGAEQLSYMQPEIEAFGAEGIAPAAATVAPKEKVIDRSKLLTAISQFDPLKYLELTQPEKTTVPTSIQEYQFAINQGYKGSFEDFKKDIARAGASSINLPSEGERKAGFLANRVKFGIEQLGEVIGKNPPSASPEALPTLIRFVTGTEFLPNKLTSEDRQRVEAAQLDILDAALTLGTGAAYTREQIEGYRKSYFPQLGDNEKTIKDKQKRLQNLLESAYISAGRAAPVGPVPTISSPVPRPESLNSGLTKDDLSLINKYLKPKR